MTELPIWPAAERNKDVIAQVLRRLLPSSGLVLEIASATGQHCEHFARAFPGLDWQPSDYDPEHLDTLKRRVAMASLSNLRAPIRLDVTKQQWAIDSADVIFNANMIHIAPWDVTLGLFAGASNVLAVGAVLITYGPYSVGGEHTSESNAQFDASLKLRDPSWGVRDVDDLTTVAADAGFKLLEQIPMPANNLTLRWQRI